MARCYLNSVVLALLHLPRFVSWLEDHVHGHEGDEWCVACILADLATQYWVDVPNQTDLEEQIDLFIAAIDAGKLSGRAISTNTDLPVENNWDESRLWEHEDAQEFYQWLITHLRQKYVSPESPSRIPNFTYQTTVVVLELICR